MFQKNFPHSRRGKSGPGQLSTSNKLKQQRHYRIDQCRGKHALRRLVAMGINIHREQPNIQQQARDRNSRDLRLIRLHKPEEVLHRIKRVESDEVVNEKAKKWCYQTRHQAQPEVVFFEYHDFHVFSSLLLRT